MKTTKRDLEAELQARVEAELTPLDVEAAYGEMLDECHEPYMGLYRASKVVQEFSPTDWRCGVCDYQDSLSRDREWTEINDELYKTDEVDEIRDEIQAEIDAEEAGADDDSPETDERIQEAACTYFDTELVYTNFEHGQWRVTLGNGAQYSVVDAEGGDSVDGFSFEQATEADDE